MALSLGWSGRLLLVCGGVGLLGLACRLWVELVLLGSLRAMSALRRLRGMCLEMTRHDALVVSFAKRTMYKYVLPLLAVVGVAENAGMLDAMFKLAFSSGQELLTEPLELSPVQFLLCFASFYFAFQLVASFKAKRRLQQGLEQAPIPAPIAARPSSLAYSLETSAALRKGLSTPTPAHAHCATNHDDGNVYYKENEFVKTRPLAKDPRGLQRYRPSTPKPPFTPYVKN
ncbi:hypothetical protein BASA81_008918 [Batrachochytrium salamandrivorans]|nr:hypothetical protein BASA81_008918 [Batrachochytrium salamandrivorans]